MKRLATTLGATALLLTPLASQAQYAFSAGYGVLDDANQAGLAAGTRFNTTGQERGIAFRPALGGDPAIVYIARGGTTTGDGRTGGVVGLAAIKLTAFGASNYTDTGLITSGGAPAAFSFIQDIDYDPVCDKVWAIDGSGATPRAWYFNGGAVGGSPSGGGTAVAAAAAGIATPFVALNATALGGSGRGIAVRVSGTGSCATERTITVALGMGTHLEVWRSTTGLTGTWAMAFESSSNPDGAGTGVAAFSTTGARDVAFDENGDIWLPNSGIGTAVAPEVATNARYIHVFSGSATGTGVTATQTIAAPVGNVAWDGLGTGASFNSLQAFREAGQTFLIGSVRSSSGAVSGIVRYRRTGATLGSYSLVAVDGFGHGITNTGNAYSDATLATNRYKATGVTLPSGGTQALMYLSLPYSSAGDLTLSTRSLFVNGFVTDVAKSQTSPSSAVVQATLPPRVTLARYFDGSGGYFTEGSTDNPLLGLTATTDQGTATVSSVTVRRTAGSTATDAEITDLKLWNDTDADGAVDGGEPLLGTTTMTGGVATFSGLTASAITAGTRLLVTVTTAAAPPPRAKGGSDATAAAMAGSLALEILAGDVVTTGASTVGGSGTLVSNDNASPLPVELSAFRAVGDTRGLTVSWTTESETNNAGFGVEIALVGRGDFREVAFVAGRGTTAERATYSREVTGLAAGRYLVRLRQVDLDGTATYAASVEAAVALDDAFALTEARPNPAAGPARMTLTVRERQSVRADLFDVTGRRVAALFAGDADALSPVDLVVDGASLPAGTYVVRVTGERFNTSRRVVVAR